MNQNQNIHIWVLPNGSKATMSILSKEITRNDIDMAISLENIVFGICNDEIDAALDRIHSSGEPQHNIVIAKEEVIQSTLLLANRQSEATPDIIRKITDHFRLSCSTLENMKAGKSPLESTETIFVLKDQKFCTISIKENNTDIFGKQVHNTHTTGLSFSIDGSIVQNRSEAGIEYIAKKEGYLVALSSGKISIADPVSTNVDKMCFLFHFMPVWWNLDALFNYYLKISQQKISDVKTTVLSDNDLHEIISSGKCSSVVVRSGRAPIAGKDAVLTFLVHNNSFIHQRENGSVDFKELSKFQYIKGGTILAEKTRPVPGIYGVNALGERITVNPPLDITFNVGINVIQKEENEKNYYIASCDGILNLQDHFIEILDVLRISGDVGPQTGNIHSEKDVFISGNVLGGFSIESKGSIKVDGCIENGATITGNLNITVGQGIFGNKTKITIMGDGEVGFIQDAHIYVEGNLHVKKYIYNSHVFCRGQLIVDGTGVETENRGCVLGGEVIAMRNMILASAGCEGENTYLYCGINPQVQQVVENLKSKIASLNKKVTILRTSINLDLNASDIKEKLQQLPPAAKEKIKKILLALKLLSQEQLSLSEQLAPLEKIEKCEKPDLCSIEIMKHLIPITTVKIYNDSKLIVDKMAKCVLKYTLGTGISVQ